MKILHLGNAYFLESFRQLGHDVKWAGYHRTADIPLSRSLLDARSLLTQLPPHWYPDLIVLGDESTQPLVLGLKLFRCRWSGMRSIRTSMPIGTSTTPRLSM